MQWLASVPHCAETSHYVSRDLNEDNTAFLYQKKISHQLVKKIISNAKVICVPPGKTRLTSGNPMDLTRQFNYTVPSTHECMHSSGSPGKEV
jgi:hypothetical protein